MEGEINRTGTGREEANGVRSERNRIEVSRFIPLPCGQFQAIWIPLCKISWGTKRWERQDYRRQEDRSRKTAGENAEIEKEKLYGRGIGEEKCDVKAGGQRIDADGTRSEKHGTSSSRSP